MSCVMYWSKCEKCNHETYGRSIAFSCEKCNSIAIYWVREWDEENDHNWDEESSYDLEEE